MTTNVPKGAGRPAAAARKRKHDQHTPLPGDEAAAAPAATPTRARRSAKAVAAKGATLVEPLGKMSQRFVDVATEHSWTVTVTHPTPGKDVIVASKDGQQVRLAQVNDKLDLTDLPTWTAGGRVVRLKNNSACCKMVSLPEDKLPVRVNLKPARQPKQHQTDDIPANAMGQGLLALMNESLIAALAGTHIEWRRSNGSKDSARVTRHHNLISISSNASGRRYVTFNAVDRDGDKEVMTGNYSVYIDTIMRQGA